nr:hypothetical chloroplast RF1 [Blidingia minima]
MMFSVLLKDYFDSLHEFALATDYVTFFGFVKATLSYVLHSLVLALYYVLSFHWLRDFMELPISFKHTYTLALEGGIIKGKAVLNLAVNNGAFSFLDGSPANRHSLFSGFFNSFFLSLPLSVAQILTLRAWLVNGSFAGICSLLGVFCGHFLFYFCMLFGLDFIMQPFFQFDFIVISVGCMITAETLYRLANFPSLTIFSVVDKKPLLNFFRLSLSLTWFEQICVSNYFGNVTVNPGFSLFETSNSGPFFLMTFFYFIGLMVGFLVWSLCFYFIIVQIRSFLSEKFVGISYFEMNQKIHYGCVIGLLAMTMSSFFYYGFDFFLTKPIGYVNEDQAMVGVRPHHRQYIEIESYMEEEDIDAEQEDEDIIVDARPFHTPDQRPETQFEVFAIQPDNDEINKEMHVERVEEKTGLYRSAEQMGKIPYVPNTDYYKDDEPEYEIPTDVEEAYGMYKGSSHWEDMNLKFINSAFRNDEYESIRDLSSSSYIPETQLYRIFRGKYNTNIVYRKLMRLNNFCFLSGQPKTSNLSSSDEIDLYNRRIAMQRYLNSIHRYKRMIEEQGISFTERVYNQQFKGSLNYVRKFNAVELSEASEELKSDANWIRQRQESLKSGKAFDIDSYTHSPNKVLKYDQPLYKKNSDEQLALLHEEVPRKLKTFKAKRFLKPNDTKPLYIGWDNQLRKFMIKSAVIGPSFKNEVLMSNLSTEKQTLENKKMDVEGKETKKSKKSASNKNKKGVKKLNRSKAERKTPRWKKMFGLTNKSKFITRLRLKKDVCDTYAPVKKQPVKTKRSLPDYYHFQAWSPGVENVNEDTLFKLPSLMATKRAYRQIQDEMELLDEDPEDEQNYDDFDPGDRDYKRKVQKQANDQRDLTNIFRRLPIYDWYWQMLDVIDADVATSFRFGDTTYPKVDGVAWPGVNNRYGLTCPGFESPDF